MKQIIPKITLFIVQWSLSLAIDSFEHFCTIETAFNANAPLFSECKGTDSQACEDAGGVYESETCDVDTTTSIKCDAIPGFVYETTVTCEQFGSYMTMIPEAAAEYKDCSSFIVVSYLIPLFQSTCCGGLMNNKDVCPDVPDTNTNSVDPCSACDENDKNINNTNISEKCGVAVAAWYELKGIDKPEECADNESASSVSAKCKDYVFSMFKCSINPCEDDYDNKFKYGNDIYSCKQLNRLKKKYRKRICTKEESARKLCAVICKNKV